MITRNQLQSFVAMARHRHFTRASEELNVAQSSVSYQIHELERVLKVRLVEVVGRRVYLTDAGEHLFARATALLNDLENLEREMAEYGQGTFGRLRLGATHTIGGYALPPVLAEFHAAHPQIDLHLVIDNVRTIEQMLLDRTIDLGVIEWTVHNPALTSQAVRRDALVLIASPRHPLVGRGPLRLSDLRGQPFILREPGSGTRSLGEEILGPVASEITVAMELSQPEAIVRVVEAGMGLAFISESIVVDQLARGTICALPLSEVALGHDFSLVVLRDRQPSRSMQIFCDFLRLAWSTPTAAEAPS